MRLSLLLLSVSLPAIWLQAHDSSEHDHARTPIASFVGIPPLIAQAKPAVGVGHARHGSSGAGGCVHFKSSSAGGKGAAVLAGAIGIFPGGDGGDGAVCGEEFLEDAAFHVVAALTGEADATVAAAGGDRHEVSSGE